MSHAVLPMYALSANVQQSLMQQERSYGINSMVELPTFESKLSDSVLSVIDNMNNDFGVGSPVTMPEIMQPIGNGRLDMLVDNTIKGFDNFGVSSSATLPMIENNSYSPNSHLNIVVKAIDTFDNFGVGSSVELPTVENNFYSPNNHLDINIGVMNTTPDFGVPSAINLPVVDEPIIVGFSNDNNIMGTTPYTTEITKIFEEFRPDLTQSPIIGKDTSRFGDDSKLMFTVSYKEPVVELLQPKPFGSSILENVFGLNDRFVDEPTVTVTDSFRPIKKASYIDVGIKDVVNLMHSMAKEPSPLDIVKKHAPHLLDEEPIIKKRIYEPVKNVVTTFKTQSDEYREISGEPSFKSIVDKHSGSQAENMSMLFQSDKIELVVDRFNLVNNSEPFVPAPKFNLDVATNLLMKYISNYEVCKPLSFVKPTESFVPEPIPAFIPLSTESSFVGDNPTDSPFLKGKFFSQGSVDYAPIEKLVPTQDIVFENRLEAYGTIIDREGYDVCKPTKFVYGNNNDLLMTDGHHRKSLMLDRNATHLPVERAESGDLGWDRGNGYARKRTPYMLEQDANRFKDTFPIIVSKEGFK